VPLSVLEVSELRTTDLLVFSAAAKVEVIVGKFCMFVQYANVGNLLNYTSKTSDKTRIAFIKSIMF